MTTPLDDIGFKLFGQEDTINLARALMEQGRRVGTAEGNYMELTTGNGSQLWGRLDQDNNCRAINAHFQGKSRNKIMIMQRVKFNDSPLDGRFLGWINPHEHHDPHNPAHQHPGDYPILFEAPDYAWYSFLQVPCQVEVQLTAFAQKIKVYGSRHEFDHDPDRSFPQESLRPSQNAGNSPEAFISGVVQECQVLENPLTHYYFQWARLKVLGGEFDIAADTTMLTTPMAAGCIIAGDFVLSGRLIFDH